MLQRIESGSDSVVLSEGMTNSGADAGKLGKPSYPCFQVMGRILGGSGYVSGLDRGYRATRSGGLGPVARIGPFVRVVNHGDRSDRIPVERSGPRHRGDSSSIERIELRPRSEQFALRRHGPWPNPTLCE